MGLKWGIFYRMRQLVVDSNKMMSNQGEMMEAQGKIISEIHRLINNCVMTKLDEHEVHLKAQDKHMEAQDKRIGHIEQALEIKVKE